MSARRLIIIWIACLSALPLRDCKIKNKIGFLSPTRVFKIINEVNGDQNRTWRAGQTRFRSDQRAFAGSLGTKILSDREVATMPVSPFPALFTRKIAVPVEFDARVRWPNCSTLHDIRDQGGCGSCWAHAVAESLSDRICIASSHQNETVHISVQDLMTCCTTCGGCHGGIVEYAFGHFVSVGIVTGGDYMTRKGCQSYSVAPETWDRTINATPGCSKHCFAGYRTPYSRDLHKGSSWHVVAKLGSATSYPMNASAKMRTVVNDAVRDIQVEIMTNGPVTCSMRIYEDFQHYRTGVYAFVTGELLAGHAMKIIGWGVDEDSKLPYWLLANSWGTDWGEGGFARVRRGVNECGIESRINAGMPRKSY
ncbi:Cathepsin B [Hypsibius exemplaris]|uniref:Cathepsin B n=1 Tax=Hypsibius exemplaris TaxID=2072580 RepID=A0A1W0X271_HYPEX|nr:Cathepsin B [Hypsibius exemplaris]